MDSGPGIRPAHFSACGGNCGAIPGLGARRRVSVFLVSEGGGLGLEALAARVGREEVPVDAAHGARALGLAQDDGDVAVEGDAVAEVGPAPLEGLDGLLHKRAQGGLAIVGGLLKAHDVAVVGLQCLANFLLERLHRELHAAQPTNGHFHVKRAFPSTFHAHEAFCGSRLTPCRREVEPAGSLRVFVSSCDQKNCVSFGDPAGEEPGNASHEDTNKAGVWVLKTGFMPIRDDGVLAGSLP